MILAIVMLLKLVYFATSKIQVIKKKFSNIWTFINTLELNLEGPLTFKLATCEIYSSGRGIDEGSSFLGLTAFAGLLNIYHSTRRNDPEHVNPQIGHIVKKKTECIRVYLWCLSIQWRRDTWSPFGGLNVRERLAVSKILT